MRRQCGCCSCVAGEVCATRFAGPTLRANFSLKVCRGFTKSLEVLFFAQLRHVHVGGSSLISSLLVGSWRVYPLADVILISSHDLGQGARCCSAASSTRSIFDIQFAARLVGSWIAFLLIELASLSAHSCEGPTCDSDELNLLSAAYNSVGDLLSIMRNYVNSTMKSVHIGKTSF